MIHKQALVDESARIADNVTIGPGAVIGPNVEIGEGTIVGPYAVIQGHTIIGQYNKISQFASVGDEPQDTTYQGEPTRLEIGDHNVIREYCSISRGTLKGGGLTKIANHNYFMAYTHVGHDCQIGNHTIMINHSALSGHVVVHDAAIIGGYAAVHQFCHIGTCTFVARATYITKDVLPYLIISGYDPIVCGINTVGLRRRGLSSTTIDTLKRAYKVIFRKGLTVQQALDELMLMRETCEELTPMIEMLRDSTRGIVR